MDSANSAKKGMNAGPTMKEINIAHRSLSIICI